MAQMIENVTALIRFLSSPDKINHNESALLLSKSSEERQSLFQQWSLELMSAVQTWSQSLEEGVFKTHSQWKAWQGERSIFTGFQLHMSVFFVFSPVSVLTQQVLPLIMKWEWGTTRNFLYQYQGAIRQDFNSVFAVFKSSTSSFVLKGLLDVWIFKSLKQTLQRKERHLTYWTGSKVTTCSFNSVFISKIIITIIWS